MGTGNSVGSRTGGYHGFPKRRTAPGKPWALSHRSAQFDENRTLHRSATGQGLEFKPAGIRLECTGCWAAHGKGYRIRFEWRLTDVAGADRREIGLANLTAGAAGHGVDLFPGDLDQHVFENAGNFPPAVAAFNQVSPRRTNAGPFHGIRKKSEDRGRKIFR